MKIVVCIKQVPDTSDVRIDSETHTLIREGVATMMNPYDSHAIEAAVSIKESLGASVTVLTMGPPQAESALREAISMGADEAVLVSDRAFAGSDTLATSYTLSEALKHVGFDIIFCGKQAIDGDTAQVGPETAEFLSIPHIAYVKKIEEVTDKSIRVQRMMEEGYDIVESSLPVLLTVVRELNIPRLPSLRGKMAAKKAKIKTLTSQDLPLETELLGLTGSPTKVGNIFPPPARSARKVLEGDVEVQVDELVQALKEMRCI